MKKNKKVVVTGGLGFIGSNLIDALLEKNFFVINLDRISYSSSFYNVQGLSNNKNYKFIKCDLNNQKKLYKIFKSEKPVAIFNLAAETHVDRSIDTPFPFIKNNILAVFNLLEVLRKYYISNKNFRLIHVSTDEVYGDIVKGRTDENFPYKPSSPYAASKASSDHLVHSYFLTYDLPIIITNCSNNYGPRQHPEKLIPKMIYNIIHNKNLPIYGDGKNSREWIYVKDHCEALIKIYLKGKIGEFYNIGSSQNVSNLKICSKLFNAFKKINYKTKSKIKFVKDRPGHDKRYALNSIKIINKLNWKNKIKIDIGLYKTVMWYLNNKEYFETLNKKDITKRFGKK
ncbi:dTDP-glucose 4,6-dehydratase [Candidatus Pelagibacter sp. HIMB1485]|uniref:dTDP-glucose 4,6-dehydratase n=1 Tax=Candidatus Pelagibacter sp. HIMB1485 TaxID=3415415 RepID=UPI003F846215